MTPVSIYLCLVFVWIDDPNVGYNQRLCPVETVQEKGFN